MVLVLSIFPWPKDLNKDELLETSMNHLQNQHEPKCIPRTLNPPTVEWKSYIQQCVDMCGSFYADTKKSSSLYGSCHFQTGKFQKLSSQAEILSTDMLKDLDVRSPQASGAAELA